MIAMYSISGMIGKPEMVKKSAQTSSYHHFVVGK